MHRLKVQRQVAPAVLPAGGVRRRGIVDLRGLPAPRDLHATRPLRVDHRQNIERPDILDITRALQHDGHVGLEVL